jgi:hypothetical protein
MADDGQKKLPVNFGGGFWWPPVWQLAEIRRPSGELRLESGNLWWQQKKWETQTEKWFTIFKKKGA